MKSALRLHVAAATVLLPALAGAADYPHRAQLQERSLSSGVGVPRVPVLTRVAGPGAAASLDALQARFAGAPGAVHTRGAGIREEEARSQSLKGDGWLLQAYADGTRMRYRNYVALESKAALGRPVAQRLSQERLYDLGRRFVTTELRDVVRLGAGEQLVPLFTEHEISGSGPADAAAGGDVEKVVASTIVFGRTVGGIDVVGPGSKVAVIFTNDGEAAGFDYDWPGYAPAGRDQDVLPMGDVRVRARGLTSVELDDPNVSLKRVECGYFDRGARRRDPAAVVQAGCGFQYTYRSIVDADVHQQDPQSGHVLAAFAEVVPAGRSIEPDSGWPEAIRIRGDQAPETAEPPPVAPAQ